jgi:hypothetical protein
MDKVTNRSIVMYMSVVGFVEITNIFIASG